MEVSRKKSVEQNDVSMKTLISFGKIGFLTGLILFFKSDKERFVALE